MGISWPKLLAQDERISGRKSLNAKAFLLLSDGQAWSGQVERTLQSAREQGVPVFVVGVGTSNGGFIPEPPPEDPQKACRPCIRARPRFAATIAGAGGTAPGLDHERDVDIAVTIIDAVRKARGGVKKAPTTLWACLAMAAIFLVLGIGYVRTAPNPFATAGVAATSSSQLL
jgi:hypothetical protein